MIVAGIHPSWSGCLWNLNYLHVHVTKHQLYFTPPAGGEYTLLVTDLTFGNATAIQMVTIFILDDLLVEGSEFFNLSLTTTNLSVTLAPDAATVTIEDIDGKLLHLQSLQSGKQKAYNYNIFPQFFRHYNWILLPGNL